MDNTLTTTADLLFTIAVGVFAFLLLAGVLWRYRSAGRVFSASHSLLEQLVSCGWSVLVLNKQGERLLGRSPEGDTLIDTKNITSLTQLSNLLRPDDAEKLLVHCAKIHNTHTPTSHNLLLRSHTGKTLEFSIGKLLWQQQPALSLLLRGVEKEYQKMLTANAENETLKQERKLHHALLNNMPMPLWVRNKELTITYCNISYMQLVEENEANAKEDSMPSLFKGAKRLALQAVETKGTASSRHRLIVEGERQLWEITEIYASELGGTIGFAQNINMLEKAESAISDHLTTLEDLLDSSSSAMIIYGVDARVKFYNQAFVRIWGVEEAWLNSEPTFAEMLEHLRDLRRLPEQMNFAAFKQQRLRTFKEITEPQEELFYLPDGRTLRNVMIPHSAGGVLFIYEDVTDRLALERSYNTLIAVQRETLDNLHEGVVVFGEDGKLKLKNPTFLSLWDLEDKDIGHGLHISQLLDRTKHLYITANWDLFKEEWIGQVQDRKYHTSRFERADGAVLDCSIVPLPDGGVLLLYIDNTAATLVERSLRERNEALEAGDKLKTEFLANMSYELRSPLTSISGFAEMLRQDYFGELSTKQREYVEGIHNSSQHLMHLINDILDLSSIEAGYMTLNISEFDIYKLLTTMMSLLSERLKEFDLVAHIECDTNIGMMHADETRIRQILFHLLSNAVKYSSDSSGSITLGASKQQGNITLWVKDNGVGISESEQQEVFDKFYRGSSGVRKPGTGLGLSMVKSFVELHGGYVTLDSALGKGTTVTCHFTQERATILPMTVAIAEDTPEVIEHDTEERMSPTIH
jgi:signal transduction histidine kinase